MKIAIVLRYGDVPLNKYFNGQTYIILGKVGMIGLNSIVEDRYDHPFPGVAFGPGGTNVHVKTILGTSVLWKKRRKLN